MNLKKELLKLQKIIKEIEIGYDYDENYAKLNNACVDYENETQDFLFENVFEEIIDEYLAEELAKKELSEYGLQRLYYFLGDCRCNSSYYRLNVYNNLEDLDKEDFDYMKSEILDIIEDRLKEIESEEE